MGDAADTKVWAARPMPLPPIGPAAWDARSHPRCAVIEAHRAHRCSFPAGLRAVSSPRFHRAAPAPPAREQGSGRLPSPIPRASDCLLTLWMTAPSAAPRPVRVLSDDAAARSEEHTSELQSLMRTTYAV